MGANLRALAQLWVFEINALILIKPCLEKRIYTLLVQIGKNSFLYEKYHVKWFEYLCTL